MDTVKYDPNGGDAMIMKILLGAIRSDMDKQEDAGSQRRAVSGIQHGLAHLEIGSNSRQGTGF